MQPSFSLGPLRPRGTRLEKGRHPQPCVEPSRHEHLDLPPVCHHAMALAARIQTLAARSYSNRLTDEHIAFRTDLRGLQMQLASNGIVGGAGVRAIVELARKTVRKRLVMAAEELQKACESDGVEGSRHLRGDLEKAWVSFTLARDFEEVHASVIEFAAPHVPHPDVIENNWQTSLVASTNLGKSDADAILSHYAVQRARDRTQFWRERAFAAGGIGIGFLIGHAGNIARWFGGIVHR